MKKEPSANSRPDFLFTFLHSRANLTYQFNIIIQTYQFTELFDVTFTSFSI